MSTQEINLRELIPGEIEITKLIFKNSVDFHRVKIHRGSYFPFNLQNENTAVTPNGEIYFMPKNYFTDFSLAPPSYQHWFIHEMTHVWQYQLGLSVRLRGALSWAATYRYSLSDKNLLSDYGMEAQASLIADYFYLVRFGVAGFDSISNLDGIIGPNIKKRYEWVLRGFISQPSNKRNLP